MLSEKLIQEPSFTMLHPSIHANFEIKKQEIAELSKGELIEKKNPISKLEGRQGLLLTNAREFLELESLNKEVFGPFAVICYYETVNQLKECTEKISGQLTATILATQEDLIENESFVFMVNQLAGRIIFNNVPTGVRVCESMHHGGPYPATTDSRFTAVGTDSITRFTRPIVHQDNC
jgi:NADP-dependent aldehyde dehydrogenase